MTFVSLDAVIERARVAWRPPPRLSLSKWAEEYFVLSSETAAEPGRWRCLPYQREIMDAFSDPDIAQITLMKSARIGYTLMMSAAIGFYMAHDPASILCVQPTVEDAKNFSKETISPMLRDVPVLSRLLFRDVEERGKGPKDKSATLTHKAFPGGVLSLIGANSGAGFRRVSRRVVMFDEVDAYPPSAGSEGDQIELGMKRAEAFYNRKIIAGSTPLIAGASRIEDLFLEGDQRRYHVPCPHCGHMDFFVFREGDRGHFMKWDPGKPETAYFVCKLNGCIIEHKDKRWMVERGEWRPDNPSGSHRSYHLWSAVSFSPNASWGQIAARFLKASKGGPEKLKTFVNTELGETWKEKGEAPDWERLYDRREKYELGTVPAGVVAITAGVDVQKDRFVYEVVGWAPSKESWSIECGEIHGDTASDATWAKLDELLARTFVCVDGSELPIARLAIDSGYNTQRVYAFAKRHTIQRVLACKGVPGARALVSAATPVDVTIGGRVMKRGAKVWPVGVDIAKGELYGWLGLRIGDGDPSPAGYCHFPAYGEDFFQQLTAEHLVTTINKRTHRARLEWQVLPGRQNHYLDARILARVAAAVIGIDRMKAATPKADATKPNEPTPAAHPIEPPAAVASERRPAFWQRSRGGGGWFGRRR